MVCLGGRDLGETSDGGLASELERDVAFRKRKQARPGRRVGNVLWKVTGWNYGKGRSGEFGMESAGCAAVVVLCMHVRCMCSGIQVAEELRTVCALVRNRAPALRTKVLRT
jgi:hypothetical protein